MNISLEFGILVVICTTIVYLIGLWSGFKTGVTNKSHEITKVVTEAVINDLVDGGYIKTKEEVIDGELTVTIIKYDET